jgi:hypothetical protein
MGELHKRDDGDGLTRRGGLKTYPLYSAPIGLTGQVKPIGVGIFNANGQQLAGLYRQQGVPVGGPVIRYGSTTKPVIPYGDLKLIRASDAVIKFLFADQAEGLGTILDTGDIIHMTLDEVKNPLMAMGVCTALVCLTGLAVLRDKLREEDTS